MLLSILIFIIAGLAEIGGGYLVWLWLRESKPIWYGVVGSLILILYGIIPTLQSFPIIWTRIRRIWGRICNPSGVMGLVGR